MRIILVKEKKTYDDELCWRFWQIKYIVDFKTRDYRRKIRIKAYQSYEFDDDYEIWGEDCPKHIEISVFKVIYNIFKIYDHQTICKQIKDKEKRK